ncbi:CDGSH iron-sulfur domain-containing protein [Kitasatospora sp. NBC_01539]|uniref:CDGSH iron-sulfur domain-containing protein n=1 Tax=Kitasatospora sp. NBC_01539 TaxID=2903577 RepID=UPI0038600D98
MLVEGPVEIVLPDGTTVRSDRPVVALCVCRRSRRYPFCDTSHRRHRPPPPAARAALAGGSGGLGGPGEPDGSGGSGGSGGSPSGGEGPAAQ